MNDIEIRETLETRFTKLFPNKRLLAVQLNGFSHTVFYDDGNSKDNYEVGYKTVASEQRDPITNTPELYELFDGFPNYAYQRNAEEIIWVMPSER